MAQKVMVFIRMGMRNSPDSLLAPAAFLLGPDQRHAALQSGVRQNTPAAC